MSKNKNDNKNENEKEKEKTYLRVNWDQSRAEREESGEHECVHQPPEPSLPTAN